MAKTKPNPAAEPAPEPAVESAAPAAEPATPAAEPADSDDFPLLDIYPCRVIRGRDATYTILEPAQYSRPEDAGMWWRVDVDGLVRTMSVAEIERLLAQHARQVEG